MTVTMQFDRRVRFREVVSPGWDCASAARNPRLTVLTCSTTLPAGEGTTFVATARALLRPSGTVTVTAADDPRSDNDSATFTAPPYLLVL